MAARHSKITQKSKTYSEGELCKRRYHSDVRKFKEWCDDNNVTYKTFNDADDDDVCVLSQDEYHLHDTRRMISEDCEDYFLNIEDYETWCEEK